MKKRNAARWLSGVLAAAMVFGTAGSVLADTEEGAKSAEENVSPYSGAGYAMDAEYEWKYFQNGDPADGTVAKDKWGQYNGWTRKYGTNAQDSSVYNDTDWETHAGSFDTLDGTLNSESQAYFFRGYFEVEDPSAIEGLHLTFDYKDAAIIYVNGQQLTSLNVPDVGYKTEDTGNGSHKDNLGYGSKDGDTENIRQADVTMRDISEMLVKGQNVIAVELHKTGADSQGYFKFGHLDLHPDTATLPDRDAVKAVSLTIGATPSELNLTWYSLATEGGQVQFAKKSDMTGDAFPEEKAETFEAVETLTQGKVYTSNQATVSGLEEDTEYVYRVGNNGIWSEQVYATKTKSSGDFSFIFAGDPQLGSSGDLDADKDGWRNTLNLIQQDPLFSEVSFIQNAGDHVEAGTSELQYDAYLANYDGSPVYSVPFATAVGNHDYKGTAYNTHFNLPNVSQLGDCGEGNANGDYYYVYNNSLFLVINSNNQSTAEHKEFMRNAIHLNPDTDWKFVIFHHSIYSTASHAVDNDILSRRSTLAPVFKELGIDAVLMGHDHVYTRSYMMDGLEPMVEESTDENGEPISEITDPSGIVYITANSASGSKYYEFSSNLEGDYVAVKNQEHVPNISKIDVSEDTFRITTYRTSDKSVVDEFTIHKTTNEKPITKTWENDGRGWRLKLSDGTYQTNSWAEINGIWYAFDEKGYMRTGWFLDTNGAWYYLSKSGAMATGWVKVGGTWYYLKESGAMAAGWIEIDGTWYYLRESGAMAIGWVQVGGTWYYLRESGAMATGWIQTGKTWYYLKDSGAMATGWLQTGGTWYYLRGSGAMATGWVQVGETWYYLRGSGAMATGWVQMGGTWYYLKESGAMATGWIKLGTTWYYLKGNGAMVSGQSLKINGKMYRFDQSGACVNP
ncbi:fibronectin type III domain-containing protein [Lactonifactor longoviformis]|uniref:fibronectin type III domain-containing protein n=1 Tax=Lactonifactor longoviformis TaxID=341220 RepID=UPI0036F35894